MMKNKKTLWIITIAIIVIAIAIVSVILIIQSNSSSRLLQKQLDLGYKYFEELNYEQAIVAFEAAIEIDPKNVEAYKGLIDAYIQNRDDQLAIEAAQRAFEETGDNYFAQMINDLSTDSVITNTDIVELNDDAVDLDVLRDELRMHVIDGIVHNEYIIEEFDEWDENLLERIISSCKDNDLRYACDLLFSDDMKTFAGKHLQANSPGSYSEYRFYFQGYKIDLFANPGAWKYVYMVLIPIDSAKGFLLEASYNDSDDLNYDSRNYGSCDCTMGMFNGSFHIDMYRSDCQSIYYIDGTVDNGLLDGTYTQVMGSKTLDDGNVELNVSDAYFDNGRLIEEQPYPCGQYILRSVESDVDGKIFYLSPHGWMYSTPSDFGNGLFVYSY